jgi:hypothetical protein
MRYIAIFSFLATLYGLLPKQNANNTTINIHNTFITQQIYQQATKTQSYWVERDCELKARPNFKSATMARIPKDVEIRVIYPSGRWLDIEYKEQGQELPKYGFVSKKYLKKMQ